ncbi:SCO2522 family protein [Rhizomonospora bruguierae]|uniref:SCO2522 family protein n=1 Tax=Rhizomonospora bruguierae TaxID=1581705 RepID=UPI0020C1057A|nr:SCO2522 family protein [Micromonospora sp. NBRC 107566]
MAPPEAIFAESAERRRVRSVPLAHLSVELGHLYFEDFLTGPDTLLRHFRTVAPWAAAARGIAAADLGRRTPRISTCFLIDDYFGPTTPPTEIIPPLLAAAEEAGLRIDYLAREAACANADGAPLARLVEERIVADPPPRTTGGRPTLAETGWLSNGQRSPSVRSAAAMDTAPAWAPPVQNAANRHSVFVDVELWSRAGNGRAEERLWSCAFLASVWQLLRLGMLRHGGEVVATPQEWSGALPERWDELPAVIRLNPQAAPFTAYRSLSILPRRFLTTEHAVRTILEQVAPEDAVVDQVIDRARGEGLDLDREPGGRIDYVFTG